MISIGQCDQCGEDSRFVVQGFLDDGTSPTFNEACEGHAGPIATSYLAGRIVRVETTRIENR
jgi:hypothetical protein